MTEFDKLTEEYLVERVSQVSFKSNDLEIALMRSFCSFGFGLVLEEKEKLWVSFGDCFDGKMK